MGVTNSHSTEWHDLALLPYQASIMQLGWEEHRPKKYSPDKLACSLVLQSADFPLPEQTELIAFCGVSELYDVKKNISPTMFPSLLVLPFDEEYFWSRVHHASGSLVIPFFGAPEVQGCEGAKRKYLEDLATAYPAWWQPIQGFVRHQQPADFMPKEVAGILAQEKPGKFFEVQTAARSWRAHVNDDKSAKNKDRRRFDDVFTRSAWGAGCLVLKPAREVPQQRLRIRQAILKTDIWEAFDDLRVIAQTIRHLGKGSLRSIVLCNFPQEMAGVIALHVREIFGPQAEPMVLFPDLLWGSHFLAHTTQFLQMQREDVMFVSLQPDQTVKMLSLVAS